MIYKLKSQKIRHELKNNNQTRPIDYPTDINKHTYIQAYYLTNDWEL